MEAVRPLADLFLTALHYEKGVNFYIYENDYHFLGTLNREVLLQLNLSSELCQRFTVGEVIKNVDKKPEIDIDYWKSEENLCALLENALLKKDVQ